MAYLQGLQSSAIAILLGKIAIGLFLIRQGLKIWVI